MEVLMAPRTTLALLSGIFLLTSPAALAQEVPTTGDLVITELLIAPGSGGREWFEVQNVSGGELELQDCVLAEDTHSDTVDESLVLADGERAMFAKSASGAPDCLVYADEALSTCAVELDFVYSSLSFNNTGTEVLSITCDGTLVDEASYEWGAFSGDCPDEYGGNCSVNLHPEAVDASDNDDLANWCVPWQAAPSWDFAGNPALNTAGGVGICFDPPDPCTDGVVITELMAAPGDGYNEWIELYGANAEACNLNGCTLKVGQSEDPAYTPTEHDDWSWKETTIEATFGTLELIPGEHLLLAKGEDWVVGDGTSEDDIPADYNYGTVNLSNSESEWVHLVCDGVALDSAPSSWGEFEAYCPQGSCSVNLSPAAYDAESNDLLESWCTPPLDVEHVGPEGDLFRGTPGAEGACFSTVSPGEGDVIFSELLASPQGGVSEYIELYNTTGGALDLDFCTLRKHRLDEAGELDPDSIKEHLIWQASGSVSIGVGSVQLLAYKDCLEASDDTGLDDTGDADAACSMGEYLYSTIQLSADQEEHLSLLCPDGEGGEVLVDTIALNVSELGIRDGHAIMLDPDLANAADNDSPSAWCEASFSQKIEDLSDGIEDCNYGTPGLLDPCLVDTPEPLEPICRCSSQQRPAGWAALALFSLASVLLGRRREQA
jgi:MYXO-CTERM domain-containing protein